MVVLAVAITTRTGKALMARQYLDLTRARVEGLLAAFPKMVTTNTQHTFVEGEAVRYVYQPLESLYVVLVTTKQSNILEDIETVGVLSKLVPEHCRTVVEDEVLKHAFDLLFAFDEVITNGLREKVSVSQVGAFLAMDSHEEKLAEIVDRNKEAEAAAERNRRMAEIERQKREAKEQGRSMPGMGGGGYGGFGGGGGGFGGGGGGGAAAFTPAVQTKPAAQPAAAPARGMMMKKADKSDAFVRDLLADGEEVAATLSSSATSSASSAAVAQASATPAAEAVRREKVHLLIEERLVVLQNHDGGVQNVEIKGGLSVLITDADAGRVVVQLQPVNSPAYSFKVHPNCNRDLFTAQHAIGLRDLSRSFPTGNPLGVLKWRAESKNESDIPLNVQCWPNPAGGGATSVMCEYELTRKNLVLRDLVVIIPIPGGQPPVVDNVMGTSQYSPKAHQLAWRVDLVDEQSPTGSIEFKVAPGGAPAGLFPISVHFRLLSTLCPVAVARVATPEGAAVQFSSELDSAVESYQLT